MDLKTIKELLEQVGIPVAYRAFRKKQAPPFICYLVAYNNNFAADGKTYYPIKHMQIELYTEMKDEELEKRVEETLSSFFWEKSEEFIETENLYQIIYEIEV